MSQAVVGGLERFQEKVNRELRKHHGFTAVVMDPLLLKTIEEAFRNRVSIGDTAWLVAQISVLWLSKTGTPTRGD